MKKEMRLQLIKQLVSEQDVKTQEELQLLLDKKGLYVTQATISRDIHILKLIKAQSKDGGLKYSFNINQEPHIFEKLRHKLMDDLVDIEIVDTFVVIKTLPCNAHSFGVLLDSIEMKGKIGTICGNDTCLIICRSPEEANRIKQQLNNIAQTCTMKLANKP